MNAETRDERLRELLRETDAARHETPLTAEEIRGMRRAVLTAVPESPRRLAPSPALAGLAMAAALAVLVILMLWPRSEPSRPARQTASKAPVEKPAAPPRPPMIPGAGTSVEDQAAVRPETAVAERRVPVRPRRADRSERGRSAESPPVAEVAAAVPDEIDRRQVQFSTPGGTRVIWILTSQEVL